MLRIRYLCVGILGLAFAAAPGCGLLHDLQPHRLQRLNRVEPMGATDYQFSIPDPPGGEIDSTPSAQDR